MHAGPITTANRGPREWTLAVFPWRDVEDIVDGKNTWWQSWPSNDDITWPLALSEAGVANLLRDDPNLELCEIALGFNEIMIMERQINLPSMLYRGHS